MIQLVDPKDAGLKQSNTLNPPRCPILAAPWSPRCPESRVPPILRGYNAPRPGYGWGRRPCVFAYLTSQRLTGSLAFTTSAKTALAPSVKHIAGQHILFAFLTETYLRGANALPEKIKKTDIYVETKLKPDEIVKIADDLMTEFGYDKNLLEINVN